MFHQAVAADRVAGDRGGAEKDEKWPLFKGGRGGLRKANRSAKPPTTAVKQGSIRGGFGAGLTRRSPAKKGFDSGARWWESGTPATSPRPKPRSPFTSTVVHHDPI